MIQDTNRIAITGIGIITPIGTGLNHFTNALKNGDTNFSFIEFGHGDVSMRFPVAKTEFNLREAIAGIPVNDMIVREVKRLRHISASVSHGVYCAMEAWADAGFNDSIDLARVCIVSGGSNTQQAAMQNVRDEYNEKIQYVNPNYGLNFFDTDMIGVLSGLLGITGEGHSIGAASASGNMALIQGYRLVNSGDYDIAVIVAPLMELSIYEYQGLTALGAMARPNEQTNAFQICRPFDKGHSGFVYGQSSGCIILESEEHLQKRNKKPYGFFAGYGISMDGNRNPNPSIEGEKRAMIKSMQMAGVQPGDIKYINTHGSSSAIGDTTEAAAIVSAGLGHAKANSTKSLVGHGLSAAGLVECIAGLIQVKENFLHKSNNLETPVSDNINWVKCKEQQVSIDCFLSNSFGFGGINTSVIIKK